MADKHNNIVFNINVLCIDFPLLREFGEVGEAFN